MKTYDWAIVIGRFRIFNRHHKKLLDRALVSANNVLCIIGSYNDQRTDANPFLASERQAMIRACYPGLRRLNFIYAFDQQGDDRLWKQQIEMRIDLFTGEYSDKPLLVANIRPGECALKEIFHDYPQSLTYHNFAGEGVPRPVKEWLLGKDSPVAGGPR